MKTIFITIFEGVEGKNILRTDILRTILSDPEVRVVLFTKSQERAEYHQKEFNNERIIYEVVGKTRPRGLDKIFMHLKFFLLRTETTYLTQRMLLQVRKNYFSYYLNLAVQWLLARPLFIKLSRFLDCYLIEDKIFASSYDKYQPDLVFLANLFDDLEIHLLRSAKKRDVRTVGLINSWDRTTARCILRLVPDKLIVFNELIRDELVQYHDIKKEKIFVGGIPHYDFHFQAPYQSRSEFFQRINVSAEKKLLVYAPIGSEYSNSDWDIIDLLEKWNKERELGKDVVILHRYPPNSFIEKEELVKRPYLICDYPGVRFSKKKGQDWDMTLDELKHLSDTLYHMSLLVCYASSISVDAAVLDRPIININFEVRENELMAKSPTHYYGKLHYKKALVTGGIRLVESPEDLKHWINLYLGNPSLDRDKRLKLAQQQCQFLDGQAGKRIGNFILSLL